MWDNFVTGAITGTVTGIAVSASFLASDRVSSAVQEFFSTQQSITDKPWYVSAYISLLRARQILRSPPSGTQLTPVGNRFYELKYSIGEKERVIVIPVRRRKPSSILAAVDEKGRDCIDLLEKYSDTDGILRNKLITPSYLDVGHLQIENLMGDTIEVKNNESIALALAEAGF